MKRFTRIALILTLCPFTHQACIGSRLDQFPRPQPESQQPSVISEQNLHPSAVFDKVDVVLDKIDAVASFIRDYNAIPKIGTCLKFIMPRFKIGRKFLMYYDHVRAKNEGRFPSFQKTTKGIATPPKQTGPEYVYIYPSQAALGISRAISAMKMLPGPGEARIPQAFKRVTCYNCRTRKEQWKRYNYFQNRRKRWPKQFYNPKHIIPASNELHLFDYVTVTVKPTTAITIKSFRDILPGPNQLPYYANMFLDVFDTHFETWNSKIKSVIQTIKQKWRKNQNNKNKEEDSGSQSSSYSSSESRSYSSSDYSSYSRESSRSNSNYSASSEYYDDETDESSRNSQNSGDEQINEPLTQNTTNGDNDEEEQYEYYSDSDDEQDGSNREEVPVDRNRNNRKYYERSSYDSNSRQIPIPKKRFSIVNSPVNNGLGNSNVKKILIKG